MNQEHISLESDTTGTSSFAVPTAREPYTTPRLSNYGRFQNITGTGGGGMNSVADDEVIAAEGTLD